MYWLTRCGTIVLACLFLMVGCGGENKPTKSQLQEALTLELPDYVKVTDFAVEAMQNTGNEVNPNYDARFNAKIEVTSPLYARDTLEGNVIFLLGTSDAGSEVELFGRSTSQLFQGSWAHDLFVEGDSVSTLGRPLTEFAKFTTIVRGSPEETAHFDALRQKNAEFAATIADLPLHDLIAEYYNNRGEFAGQYAIADVINSRSEKNSNEQFVVHARYSYKKLNANAASGEDRRTFTFQNMQGKWQVVAMGFASSGRIE